MISGGGPGASSIYRPISLACPPQDVLEDLDKSVAEEKAREERMKHLG